MTSPFVVPVGRPSVGVVCGSELSDLPSLDCPNVSTECDGRHTALAETLLKHQAKQANGAMPAPIVMQEEALATSVRPHPYRLALEPRDPMALRESLHPDVVF